MSNDKEIQDEKSALYLLQKGVMGANVPPMSSTQNMTLKLLSLVFQT